jgi:hypothetical protein
MSISPKRLISCIKLLLINSLMSCLVILPKYLSMFILPRKIVLYGHLISDSDQCLASERYRYPSYSEFNFFYRKFTCIGYKFVTFDEFIKSKYKRMILITFDDGFKEVFDFYQRYKIGFMAFIPTDIFDVKVSSLGGVFKNARKSDYLTLGQVKKLKEGGVHIGFHTKSHKKILDLKSDLDELVIPDDRTGLFSLPLAFAYPFESPKNYTEFDSYLFDKGFEYIFDSKSLFESEGKHIYRVSMDTNKECHYLNFIERNIYRALISVLYGKFKGLWT